MSTTDLTRKQTPDDRAGSWPAVAWCAMLAVSWWVLAPRSLALPDPAADPFATTTALLRFGAAAVLVRLTAATALAVVGSIIRSRSLVSSAIRLAPRAARTSLARWSAPGLLIASTALAGTVGTGTPAMAGPVPAEPGTTVVTTSVPTSPTSPTGPTTPPTMRRLETSSTSTEAAPGPAADASSPSVDPSAPPGDPDSPGAEALPTPAPAPAPASTTATWTIEPGQHLWLVAATTLEQRLGGPVDDATTASYHQALVALNRGRLADPDNPDLVFAGQVIELPATPAAP